MFAGAQAGLRSERLEVKLFGRNEFDAAMGSRDGLPPAVMLFDEVPTGVVPNGFQLAPMTDGFMRPRGPRVLPSLTPFAEFPQILPGESQSDMCEPAADSEQRVLPSESERAVSLPGDAWSEAVVEGPGSALGNSMWLSTEDSLTGVTIRQLGDGDTFTDTVDLSTAGSMFAEHATDDLALNLLDPLVVQGMSFEDRCDLLRTVVSHRQTLITSVVENVQDLAKAGKLAREAVEKLIGRISYVLDLADPDLFGKVENQAERALLHSTFMSSTQALTNLRSRLQTLQKAMVGRLRGDVVELVTGFTPNVSMPLSRASGTVEVPGSLYFLPQALNTWLRSNGFIAYVEPDGVIVCHQNMLSEFKPKLSPNNPLSGAMWDAETGPDVNDPYLNMVLGLLNWEMSVGSVLDGTVEIRFSPKK